MKSTSQILNNQNSKPTASSAVTAPEDLDPELVRYLDRNYWEQKEKEKAKAKSAAVSTPSSEVKKSVVVAETSPSKSGRCYIFIKMIKILDLKPIL